MMNANSYMNRLVKGQKGQAFLLAIVMLLFGALVLTPLLGYIGDGIVAGQTFENKTDEIYAADAGIEEAIWHLNDGGSQLPGGELPVWGDDPVTLPDITVNGKTISVDIVPLFGEDTYLLVSRTVPDEDGSSTTVQCFVGDITADFSDLLNNVITSQSGIEYPPNPNIEPLTGEHEPQDYYTGEWPSPEYLSYWYWWDVSSVSPEASDEFDLDGVDESLGPIYRQGEYEIGNSSNTEAILNLDGTLYITDQAVIGKSTKDFELDMNGHAIYVESDVTGGGQSGTALWIGSNCTLKGPGVVIAVGDIYFSPNIDASGGPVFILSVTGTTLLQPHGSFLGAVAGSVDVQIQPDKPEDSLVYPPGDDPFAGVNFPGFVRHHFWGMLSYEINTPLKDY